MSENVSECVGRAMMDYGQPAVDGLCPFGDPAVDGQCPFGDPAVDGLCPFGESWRNLASRVGGLVRLRRSNAGVVIYDCREYNS